MWIIYDWLFCSRLRLMYFLGRYLSKILRENKREFKKLDVDFYDLDRVLYIIDKNINK